MKNKAKPTTNLSETDIETLTAFLFRSNWNGPINEVIWLLNGIGLEIKLQPKTKRDL